LTAARQFDEKHPGDGALEAFLEEACLVNDTDAWAAEDDRVTLMTLHASKGLEFPAVFIVALEEGLMPHERTRQDEAMLEEERRLLFVGITRAQEELELSRAVYREFRGQRRLTVPSLFLVELPRGEMEMMESSSPANVEWDESDQSHAEPDGELPWETEVHDETAQIDAAHDEFVEQPAAIERSSATAQPPTAVAIRPLVTAAEVERAESPQLAPVSPDTFYQGMVVKHPVYGLGKVVALSGNGPRRSATVAFASSAGQKRFMLMHSDLRPIKNG